MITTRLFQCRFTSAIFILFATLQITACSTEELATAISPGVGSNPTTEVNNTTTAAANLTLSWTPPAAREDNNPLSLSEIAGYKVYYGTTSGQYPNSTSINDGSATGYTLNNLPSATYYLVVTTIDTSGRESRFSTEVVLSI